MGGDPTLKEIIMKYSVIVNKEGKLVYIDGKGQEKNITITKEAASKISEVYGKTETPAPVKVEDKVENEPKYGVKIVPNDLLGYPGIIKGDNGLYYLVCTCCGSTITPTQARHGIKKHKQAMCIDCQRKYDKEKKVFRCPEQRFGRPIKFHKPCQNTEGGCKKEVSGMQTALSLEVTQGKYRLCPACLAKYGKTKPVRESTLANAISAEVAALEVPVALTGGPEI